VSARVGSPKLGTDEHGPAAIVVFVGVAVLVLRPFVDAAPSTRTALFAASYLTIGLASIAVPLERDRPGCRRVSPCCWGSGPSS
jgi:hypothetical protein